MNTKQNDQSILIGRGGLMGLGLALALAACGGTSEPVDTAQPLTKAKALEMMIPDLQGDFHVVKSVSLVTQASSLVWKANIDDASYTVAANAVGGGMRITTTKAGSDHQLILESVGSSFSIASMRGAEGKIGMTYGGGALGPVGGPAATEDDLPGVSAYFEAVLADDLGISAALTLFALPQIIELAEEENPPTESASFLAGLLKLLKGAIKVIGGLFGGGGGAGPECPNGSSASCVDSSGNRNSVNCSDCSAHCTQTYGVGGTLCACGCGL